MDWQSLSTEFCASTGENRPSIKTINILSPFFFPWTHPSFGSLTWMSLTWSNDCYFQSPYYFPSGWQKSYMTVWSHLCLGLRCPQSQNRQPAGTQIGAHSWNKAHRWMPLDTGRCCCREPFIIQMYWYCCHRARNNAVHVRYCNDLKTFDIISPLW